MELFTLFRARSCCLRAQNGTTQLPYPWTTSLPLAKCSSFSYSYCKLPLDKWCAVIFTQVYRVKGLKFTSMLWKFQSHKLRLSYCAFYSVVHCQGRILSDCHFCPCYFFLLGPFWYQKIIFFINYHYKSNVSNVF